MKAALRYSMLAGLLLLLLTIGSCSKPEGTIQPTPPDTVATNVPTVNNPAGPTNTDGAETILIPGGTFQMGSSPADTLAEADEAPVHTVTLDGFYIYTHEVTNGQYAACVEAGACAPVTELASGPTLYTSDPAYAEFPVVGVTWNMAAAYCTWAGGRLPTEAEWEYAARGTGNLLQPWGADAADCNRVNMSGCQTPAGTVAVGSYLLGNSPFGVWDMSGNVWEWTQDWYAEAYYSFSPAVNPFGPAIAQDPDQPLKTLRGGGFNSDLEQMRSAARLGANPYRAYNDVGFRCVAQAALEMPGNYEETGIRFELPDEDGENAEDPGTPTENFYNILHGSASCPDAEGQVHIEIKILATPDSTFSLSVFDVPFACTYDKDSDTLKCDGTAAPQYYETHKTLMDLQINYPNGETEVITYYNIPIPDDCGSADVSHDFTANVSCPADGFVTATFTYDPTDVTWQEVYLRSMDTPLPCEVVSEGVLVCTAPNITEGGFYEFYMYGENDEGLGRKRWPDVPAPEGCPAAAELEITASTSCFLETIPTAKFYYDPEPHGNVKTVQDAGEFRLHVNWEPGVTESMYTDETPGHVTTMTLCFNDGYCQDVTDITVPDCSEGGTERGYTIDPICYAPGEDDPFNSGLSLQYWPTDQMLASVTADGTALTCDEMGEGWFACYTLPGEAGDIAQIEFCLANGECHTGTVETRYCPTPTTHYTLCMGGPDGPPRFNLVYDSNYTAGLDAVYDDGELQTCDEFAPGKASCTFKDPTPGRKTSMTICFTGQSCFDMPDVYVPACGSASEWTFAGAGCHPWPDPDYVSFMVDTGYDWLTPDADVDLTATDGIRVYACVAHPSVAGRIYCYGLQPTQPATLNLCISQPGQPSNCQSFPDYYDWVSYLTCPEPTEEPVDTGPSAAFCKSFTSPSDCSNNGCNWIGPVAAGSSCVP